MSSAGYIILLLCLAAWGTLAGWRNGLLAQTGSVLGIAFSIAGVRFLLTDFMPAIESWAVGNIDVPCPEYLVSSLTAAIITGGFYLLFMLCGLVLNRLLKILAVRPIDSVLGCLFGLFKWMFLVSVFYNLVLGFQQDGALLRLSNSGDGNPVEIVMPLAPVICGAVTPDELHHRMQLLEARSISQNLQYECVRSGHVTYKGKC